MATVGTFEAKTKLSELLDRVAKGETITISRHGMPAARLVPVHESGERLSYGEMVAGLRALRSRAKRGPESLRELINEGRRR